MLAWVALIAHILSVSLSQPRAMSLIAIDFYYLFVCVINLVASALHWAHHNRGMLFTRCRAIDCVCAIRLLYLFAIFFHSLGSY